MATTGEDIVGGGGESGRAPLSSQACPSHPLPQAARPQGDGGLTTRALVRWRGGPAVAGGRPSQPEAAEGN